MARKLKNRIIYIDSTSSSDSDSEIDDPDFETRWFPRLVGKNGSLSIQDSPLPKQKNSKNYSSQKKKVNEIPKKARSKRQRVATKREKIEKKENILEWLMDNEIVRENEIVRYVDKDGLRPNNGGLITRKGISCFCCFEVFKLGEFQFHGGGKNIDGNSCDNIFLVEKGVYLSCLVDSDLHDDACIICADGGDLMCCEGCPSTYHHKCMGWEAIPEGSWYCPYCVCRFCGNPASEGDYLMACPHCKMRYHWVCQQRREQPFNIDLNSTLFGPFCEKNCREVYEKMQRMVGEKICVEGGYTWSLLRRIDEEESSTTMSMCVQNPYRRIECNSKLEIAWGVMKECFEPIIDRHTSIDVLQSIVYNHRSIFYRIDFSSFYTAVLEKDDEIVSVACVRIHKNKIAEMPFIATREIHRGNGFCSKLLAQIEYALCWLKVEYLVIPSIRERIGSWNRRHKFGPISPNLKKELMGCNTLMFHNSVRLQKTLSHQQTTAMVISEAGTDNHQNQLSDNIGNFSDE